MPRAILVFALLFTFSAEAMRSSFDCTDLLLVPVVARTLSLTPTGDFAFRDTLPQTELPQSKWDSCCGSYGPCAQPYPAVVFPEGVDHLEWSRQRVIEAAKKWIGLPYAHRHIPAMGGLDCSNFTAWVYNYAFGIRFSSKIERQAMEAGRFLESQEKLAPGDLIFIYSEDFKRIYHVVFYVDEKTVLDSHDTGIQLRPFAGHYRTHYAWARRILE